MGEGKPRRRQDLWIGSLRFTLSDPSPSIPVLGMAPQEPRIATDVGAPLSESIPIAELVT
jgi:hypothetical protein